MTLSGDDLRRIAGLAKLRLDEQEESHLLRDVTRVLGYVESLAELLPAEPGSAEPDGEMPSAESGRSVAEPDRLTHGPGQMAPEWADGLFLVPPPTGVIPEDS